MSREEYLDVQMLLTENVWKWADHDLSFHWEHTEGEGSVHSGHSENIINLKTFDI